MYLTYKFVLAPILQQTIIPPVLYKPYFPF